MFCNKNKIMYVLSWQTVSVLTRELFLCLLPSLLRNSGNKRKNKPLVNAETIRHSSTFIILYIFDHPAAAFVRFNGIRWQVVKDSHHEAIIYNRTFHLHQSIISVLESGPVYIEIYFHTRIKILINLLIHNGNPLTDTHGLQLETDFQSQWEFIYNEVGLGDLSTRWSS